MNRDIHLRYYLMTVYHYCNYYCYYFLSFLGNELIVEYSVVSVEAWPYFVGRRNKY